MVQQESLESNIRHDLVVERFSGNVKKWTMFSTANEAQLTSQCDCSNNSSNSASNSDGVSLSAYAVEHYCAGD